MERGKHFPFSILVAEKKQLRTGLFQKEPCEKLSVRIREDKRSSRHGKGKGNQPKKKFLGEKDVHRSLKKES